MPLGPTINAKNTSIIILEPMRPTIIYIYLLIINPDMFIHDEILILLIKLV